MNSQGSDERLAEVERNDHVSDVAAVAVIEPEGQRRAVDEFPPGSFTVSLRVLGQFPQCDAERMRGSAHRRIGEIVPERELLPRLGVHLRGDVEPSSAPMEIAQAPTEADR
jgi:hypothetical protein